MKRSRALLVSALMGTAYIIFLAVLGFIFAPQVVPGATLTVVDRAQDVTSVMAHMICAALAVALNWIGFAKNSRIATLLSSFLYAAAAVVLYICAPFVVVQMIVCFIACSGLRRLQRLNREAQMRAAYAVPSQEIPAAPAIAPPTVLREREQGDKSVRKDGLSIAMTMLSVLVLAGVVGILIYGVSMNKAAFGRFSDIFQSAVSQETIASREDAEDYDGFVGDMDDYSDLLYDDYDGADEEFEGENEYLEEDKYTGENEYAGENEYFGEDEYTGENEYPDTKEPYGGGQIYG